MGIGTPDPVPVCCVERRSGVEGISALIVRGVLKSFLGKVIRGTVTHTVTGHANRETGFFSGVDLIYCKTRLYLVRFC